VKVEVFGSGQVTGQKFYVSECDLQWNCERETFSVIDVRFLCNS